MGRARSSRMTSPVAQGFPGLAGFWLSRKDITRAVLGVSLQPGCVHGLCGGGQAMGRAGGMCLVL